MGGAEKKQCAVQILRCWRSRAHALHGGDFPLRAEPGARTARRRFSFMGEAKNQRYSVQIFLHGYSR